MNRRAAVHTVVIAAGVVLGVAMVCLPLEQGLSHFVIEDMFYYLTSARNVVAGRGPSLDGLHATNGFHPLWMLLLAGISLVTGGRSLLTFHLALGLALLFHWLALGLLVACVRRLLGPAPALAVAAALTLNYRLLSIPLGGLETALAGALVMAVTVVYAFGRPLETMRGALGFGLLLGVTFLARLDSLLLGAVLLAFAALAPGVGARRRRGLTMVAGSVALAVCLPWFAFSLRATGTLLPASGEAITALSGNPWHSISNPREAAALLFWLLRPPANDLCNVLGLSPWILRAGPAGYAAVAAAGILAAALAGWAWRQRQSPLVRPLAWVPAYAGLHLAYYLWFGQPLFRYFYPVLFPVLFFAAAVASAAARRRASRRWQEGRLLFAVPLALVSVSAVAGWQAFRLGLADGPFHGLHPALYRAALWIERQTPPDAVVGAFNGGILSYFSGRPTVGLDGVMNYSVIGAIRERRLADYIRTNGITHLADVESQLDGNMEGFSGAARWRDGYREVFRTKGPYRGGEQWLRIVVLERRPAKAGQ